MSESFKHRNHWYRRVRDIYHLRDFAITLNGDELS